MGRLFVRLHGYACTIENVCTYVCMHKLTYIHTFSIVHACIQYVCNDCLKMVHEPFSVDTGQ